MLLLTDTQKCPLSITPVDSKGNPAEVDGAPEWSVADPALLTIDVAPDGMSATIAAVGPLGSTQVNVTADADLGAGTEPVSGVLDVTVQAGKAVSLGIKAGAPEEA